MLNKLENYFTDVTVKCFTIIAITPRAVRSYVQNTLYLKAVR